VFTSVYFFESGLFNELRPIQIKKIPVLSQVVCETSQRAPSPLPSRPGAPSTARSMRPTEIGIAHVLDFEKRLHVKNFIVLPGLIRGGRSTTAGLPPV
jgi:hypothetical protein